MFVVRGRGDMVLACGLHHRVGKPPDRRGDLAEGAVIVDATVPLATNVGGRPTQTLGVWAGSAAQQAASLIPDGVGIVAGLHTVSADLLGDLDHDLDEDALLCGDDRSAMARVAAVIDLIPGLRCVDCGKL